MPKNTRARTVWTLRSALGEAGMLSRVTAHSLYSERGAGPAQGNEEWSSGRMPPGTGRSLQEFSMLLTSVIASAVGGILVLCSISGMAAQSGAGPPPRFGVVRRRGHRIELGVRHGPEGLESGSALLSDGPLFRCEPRSRNLRIPWRYDIDAGAGAVFEISAGLIFESGSVWVTCSIVGADEDQCSG